MTTTTPQRFAPGSFCWTELHTAAPAASKAFYSGLFGWQPSDTPLPAGGVYTMLSLEGHELAALTQAREGATRWHNYLATDDVDASVAIARAKGATVLAGPFDVMDAGRMAALLDPAGVPFSLWQAGRHTGSALRNAEAGSMCWHDVFSPDPQATLGFLTALFDYQVDTAETPHGRFHLLTAPGQAEKELALHQAMEGWAPATQPFFSVRDAEATHAKAVALGAEVLCPPMDAGGGRFAHFRDPQGATFGIFEWAT